MNCFKKLTVFVLAVMMIFSMTATAFAGESRKSTATSYSMLNVNDNSCVFTNYVQGYELRVESGMEVDDSMMDIVTVLENESKRIEIYKQDVSSAGKAGYINYSNKFLTNTGNDYYYDVSQWDQTSAAYGTGEVREVSITQWSRKSLTRVENDKNHYLCIEIPDGKYVYTIFIKTAYKITDASEISGIANNFKTFIPSKQAKAFKAEAVSPDDRSWNDETRDFYDTYFHDDAALTWGIFEPDVEYKGYDTLNGYEKYLDYEFPVLLSYGELKNTSIETVRNRLNEAYDRGKILELTLQTTWTNSGNMVYDILDGKYDEYLYEYASAINEFGHPVLFRLFNEMNGDWCPYSSYNTAKDTLIFKEAYRYIYGIFEEAGANSNTIWVWNPNSVSYPNFDWNHALMYYPGDEYVDIVGLTAYNTGTYYAGEKWSTFTELYSELYSNYSEWFEQPFMITEFASASTGGDKAAWMEDMFRKIQAYDRIKIAIWWDGCDWDAYGNVARSYFLDETQEILDVFKKGIVVPWYRDTYA